MTGPQSSRRNNPLGKLGYHQLSISNSKSSGTVPPSRPFSRPSRDIHEPSLVISHHRIRPTPVQPAPHPPRLTNQAMQPACQPEGGRPTWVDCTQCRLLKLKGEGNSMEMWSKMGERVRADCSRFTRLTRMVVPRSFNNHNNNRLERPRYRKTHFVLQRALVAEGFPDRCRTLLPPLLGSCR